MRGLNEIKDPNVAIILAYKGIPTLPFKAGLEGKKNKIRERFWRIENSEKRDLRAKNGLKEKQSEKSEKYKYFTVSLKHLLNPFRSFEFLK